VNLVDGAQVRVGGIQVGTVDGISARGGVADVVLSIDDHKLWPLHEGTRARIRFGSTVSYALRYVELEPGASGGRALADGARLPVADTTTPVEFDQLFNVFDKGARRDLGTFLDHAATTFGPRGQQLGAGLRASSPALDELAGFMQHVGADPYALGTLVRTSAGTARTLVRREPQVRDLVAGAAATFDEIAGHAGATRATLARLPRTLRAARATLRRAQVSLGGVDALVGDLAPGARQTRSLSAPLADAAGALRVVAPELDTTLRTVGRAAPPVMRFLEDARPLLGQLGPTLGRLAPMASCLRPYAPELGGFFATWHSFALQYDALGHNARTHQQQFRYGNAATEPPAAQQRKDPNLDYAFVRPPGYLAGDTQYLPQCGAGPAGLDASKDPEARG
jgi:phospholipid/cholesterol/gamma-HCH transport system substrate-binding protein